MAYTTSNPPSFTGDGVGGQPPRVWSYHSTDSATVVAGTNYFTNGGQLGMAVGDLVMVKVAGSGVITNCYVSAIGTSSPWPVTVTVSAVGSSGSGSGTASVTYWASPEQFNANAGNDPTQDDAPAFRLAIAASKYVQVDGSKTYYFNSTQAGDSGSCINVTDRELILDLQNATIYNQNGKTTFAINQTPTHDIVITARVDESILLETSVTLSYVTKLTLASVTGLSAGDVVKIASNDLIPGMPSTAAGNNYQQGEFAVIAQVSAPYVWLTSVLFETYTTNPRLGRCRPNQIEIIGGRFDYDPALFAAHVHMNHFWMKGCVYPVLRDIEIKGSSGNGIVSESSYMMDAQRLRISNCYQWDGLGYGYFIASCKGERVQVKGTNCRHIVTCNPSDAGTGSPRVDFTSGSEFYWRHGRSWDTLVYDSQGDACRNAAFDMHGDAYGALFANCIATNCFQGAGSLGCGFQLAGDNCMMFGCQTRDCSNGVQVLNRNTDDNPGVGLNLRMVNCDIEAIDRALACINNSTTDTDNVQLTVEGGRLAGGGVLKGDMIQVTKSDVTFRNVLFQPTGGGTAGTGGKICRVPARGNVRMEDCRIDLTRATGTWTGTTLECFLTTPADSSRYIRLSDRADVSADVGNAALTMTPSTPSNVYYNTAITANRVVTLPVIPGPPITVIRTAAATGAFTVSVGGLKLLDAGQWATVAHPGGVNNPAWILVRYGTMA